MVRQSVYRRLAGYEDVNDAERLSQDPTFRLIGSEQLWERGAALTSRVHSFETELLARDENLAGLAAINRALIARRCRYRRDSRHFRCYRLGGHRAGRGGGVREIGCQCGHSVCWGSREAQNGLFWGPPGWDLLMAGDQSVY